MNKLSHNAQTFLNNFKMRIVSTRQLENVILTTENNDNVRAYLELIKKGYLTELSYNRGFAIYTLSELD